MYKKNIDELNNILTTLYFFLSWKHMSYKMYRIPLPYENRIAGFTRGKIKLIL